MNKADHSLYTQEIINSIIVTGSVARELSDDMKRQLIDKLYENAVNKGIIWKGAGKDNRWKFRNCKGKIVAKTTEAAIKKAYLEDLVERDKLGNIDMTFAELFQLWLRYKHEGVGIGPKLLSPSTYKRYLNDYKKYIAGTAFDEMKIGCITPIDIEEFFMGMVKKFEMGKQSHKNVAGYVKGAFRYARKKRILSPDPFEDADLSMSYARCKDTKKPTEQVVMTADGVRRLLSVVYDHEVRNESYMPDYAIELSCHTGMRVGELAGLNWSSVKEDGIHIDFSEHRYDYEDKPSEYLVGEPKKGKHRVFPMTDEMKELFSRIRKIQKKYGIESEYVFEGPEGRYSARKIGQAMARRCSEAGLSCKCIHGMRKTVSSHLRTKLPRATVAELMGHLPETNENFYNFDITELEYKKNMVSELWNESFKPRESCVLEKV